MFGLSKYLTGGAVLIALAGAGWGWDQSRRADVLSARLSAAQSDLAQCRADAAQRRIIDDAVSTVEHLAPDALTGWLRDRAGISGNQRPDL